MAAASGIDIQRLFRTEMITLAHAPLLVMLSERFFADTANAVAVPKCHDKVHPFLMAVGALRAGEQFVHTRKGLVGQ